MDPSWHGRATQRKRLGAFGDEYQLSDKGIDALAQLDKLDYLLIPGFLLSHRSLNTLSALPRLQHLHAPFSVADPRLIARLAAMKDLKTLTFGVLEGDASSLAVLDDMSPLKTLQLFVFGDAICGDRARQQALTEKLKKILPQAEVHLIFMTESQGASVMF